MSSDKRDFSDFENFPGEINVDKYQFPSLYYIDGSNKTRIWTIYVRLVKDSINGKRPKHKHNWNLMEENQIPIIKEYLLNKELPPNVVSQFWVETGVIDGKISRHPPTYPKKTNIGKVNERNTLKQGLVDARSKYLKKYEEGGRPKNEFSRKKKLPKNKKFFPMLARKYDDEKKHVVWPAMGQPKLDGVRCLAFLNINPDKKKVSYEDVILQTRQQKEFSGFNHIRRILLEPLIELYNITQNESLYLDGEFYKHGKALQDISGEVRNIEKNSIVNKDSVKYHVFDCFYPTELSMPFIDRQEILEDFFELLNISEIDWSGTKLKKSDQTKEMVVNVATLKFKDEKSAMKKYKEWVDKGYEGFMYRNPHGVYLAHPTKTGTFLRSRELLKLKMRYSDEFELVGFSEGKKGRDKGAIMWVCKTKDGEKTFNATPKNTTLQKRYELFKKISKKGVFENEYKGRMMTIEYEDLSKSGVPLRAKAVAIRDYE